MKRKNLYGQGNDSFDCLVCGTVVAKLENGGYRNHCTHCLYSRHVDIIPGDRSNDCRGMMMPIGVFSSGKKGWVIKYYCERCGAAINNKAAPDDNFNTLCTLSQP